MKFLFHNDFCNAMNEMEGEKDEREITINPNSCSQDKFKSFTCSYIYSTRNTMSLLSDISEKLDTVISNSQLLEGRVKSLEEDVVVIKQDMTNALELKDSEILELRGLITENKKRMDDMDLVLGQLRADHGRETAAWKKKTEKLAEETLTLERYTRSFNFRMFKLNESAGETSKDVVDAVNKIIHEVIGKPIKVEYGHRSGPKRPDGQSRAVICRIASRSERAEVMKRRNDFFKKGYLLFDDLPAADLAEKKKHSEAMQRLWAQGQKNQLFVWGKWYLNGAVYNG